MSSFETRESVRLTFKQAFPKKVRSVISGKLEYKYPNSKEKLVRRFMTRLATGLALLCILAANIAIYGLKVWMKGCRHPFLRHNYNTIFSVVLAVTISVINASYVKMAEMLSEYENHRTVRARILPLSWDDAGAIRIAEGSRCLCFFSLLSPAVGVFLRTPSSGTAKYRSSSWCRCCRPSVASLTAPTPRLPLRGAVGSTPAW